jgi:hypothetical protein
LPASILSRRATEILIRRANAERRSISSEIVVLLEQALGTTGK